MSTSPSWFDQEKFSRLVKKVGPKPVTEALPPPPGAEPEDQSPSVEGLASTARISLVSRPPSLLSEHRALPALPRRTTPLPVLKALFPTPARTAPVPSQPPAQVKDAPSIKTPPVREMAKDAAPEVEDSAPLSQEGDDLAEVWQKMSLLNEELAHTVQERDQAISEGMRLREQLSQANETIEERKGKTASTEDLARVTEERDDARHEYATLRQEFETFKQEQTPKEESGKFRKELEQQVEGFRQKLEERNREVAALKATSGGAGIAVGGDEKLKQEMAALREQLQRAKDEASIAQRGLALSQKALHETRDTLREATEGTSLSRHNFDNLKSECAILAQQNTVLQAQNDQLTRDLAAAKSKMTSRL